MKIPTLKLDPNRLKKLLRGVGLLTLVTVFAVLLASAAAGENHRTCSSLQISIDGTQDLFFVDPQAIRSELGKLDADTFIGRPLQSIDLSSIELALEEMPHIEEAEAWIGTGGTLCVNLEQRVPMLRVIHNKGVSYYLDIHGEKMPSTRTFTARVHVLTGVEAVDEKTLAEVVELATYIREHSYLAALVEQIHRDESGEFELVPKVGDHLIKLGGISDMEGKFDRLQTIYRDGLNYTGWDAYQIIDLRYRDLVYGVRN